MGNTSGKTVSQWTEISIVTQIKSTNFQLQTWIIQTFNQRGEELLRNKIRRCIFYEMHNSIHTYNQ